MDNMMWDENKYIVLYVYAGAISRRLVSIDVGAMSMRFDDGL